jgi:peptide/nickel transport system substrate-binding protein
MGKRSTISRAAVIGLAILIIAAAGLAGYFLTIPTVKVKDSLLVGTTDSVQTTLDPAEAYDYFGVNMIQNIGEGLFTYEPGTGKLVNQLATGYTISDGGKTWTVNLRTDAKFQDGSAFNAEAMKFSLDRTIKMNLDPAFLIGDIIDRVEVTGSHQIKITLKNNFGEEYVKALLSTWVAYAVNPKSTPCCDPERDLFKPPRVADTIDPYRVSRWEPGQFIELSANTNYYGPKPKTPKVIIKFFKDPDSLTAIKAGDIDVAFRTLSPATVKALKADPNVQVVAGPGVAPIRYLVFNTNKSPFDNRLIRQAIAYIIDRDRIVNTLFLGERFQQH